MAISTVKATINGTEYNLTYNAGTGKYEATLTAPSKSSYTKSGHYYPVSVTATNTAGSYTTVDDTDATLGASLKLVVKEKVKPVAAFVSPGAGARLTTNAPPIVVDITDDDSGINLSTFALKIDAGSALGIGAAGMSQSAISGGYRITYTPQTALSDGAHTIAANVSDYDGNAATQASVSFTVDTIAPSLNVTSPTNGLVTNQTSVTVAGTTSDATSGPATITITLDGNDVGAVTVNPDTGAFSKTLTGLTSGAHTIVVTAKDLANQTSTVTRNITVDTSTPVFVSITLTPNPVDAGATYVISVDVV